ncbi:molecular chaperone TorD [Aeromonas cavernicola]|uniref:Chaperone protein TorD n=1 Tax=Aeromonas cavernicola TaxID=1006623 RepID=A0A2H9U4P2_9GAMM|nr:molecular chaperone TorD [Aeromonas cavernicola]PJG58949.1 molecular chaperone TorD [Aeromonas cavernicola]
MQDFIATSERRAELYWWFSTLFATELSDEQIAEYGAYDVRSFLKSLATLDPMRDAVGALNEVIARLLIRHNRQSSLAADFGHLFLVKPEQGALPFASLYHPAEPLSTFPAFQLTECVSRLGIHRHDQLKDPTDHLAVQLDVMSQLITQAMEASTTPQRTTWLTQQESLLHCHLLPWFPHFEARCHAADAFGFYGASARLLGIFLQMDANYLNLIKSADDAD